MSFRDDDSGGSHLHRPYFQSQRSSGSDLSNHHPIDFNSYLNNTSTAFKSQGGFLSSDNSMEYPFTNAQWKELERQAMIYKYMVASIPIPIDLLVPSFSSSTPIISSSPNLVRYANGKVDMEPGRCKRTDGKKWRCSRDVAPNQKYCERHMNRGRPRSRKHVEQQQQQQQRQQTCLNDNNIPKKPRHDDTTHNNLSVQALPTSNNNHITNMTQNSHFLGVEVGSSATTSSLQPYHQYPYINNFDYSRNLEWVIKTEEQQQWLHLMQSKMEITENPHEGLEEESFLNLSRDCTALFLNPDDNSNTDVVSDQSSRSFIDAWSKTTTTTTVENSETTDVGTLSPSLLTLSMGNWVNPNPGPCSWVSPLAEVLRPSAAAAVVGDGGDSGSPMARSPSGVLQKTTMTSLSDSSNCSSPKLKPEIALF